MVVHIGYHKTGTTYLQKDVFPKLQGINYYDYEHSKKLFQHLLESTTLEFNASHYKEVSETNKNSLYSLEALVGHIGTGVYNYEIANRLKVIGVNKVIVSIRKQTDIIPSLYQQYVKKGGGNETA